MQTFEQYLEEKFMNQREVGGIAITKDNYESLSDNLFESLDVQEVINYAQEWGNDLYQKGFDKAIDESNKALQIKLNEN